MAKNSKKDSGSGISCDIEQIYGYLNDDEDKVLAKVSWNGRPAKTELRAMVTYDGEKRLGKGLALTDDELVKLRDLIDETLGKSGESPFVDFSNIFSSADSIINNRSKGFTTKDGFIQLKKSK